MKKKVFSLLTTLVMVISLVGVVPAMSVGAENSDFDYEKIIYDEHISKIMAEFYKVPEIAQAEKAADDVIQSYTTKDENTAALYKSISEHTSIILRGLLSKMGFVDSYEDQLKKKSITMFLNQSAINESELKKSISKVEGKLSLAKKSVDNYDKLRKIMTEDKSNPISAKEADKIIDSVDKKKTTISKYIGTELGVVDETLKATQFCFETFELYSIQIDYIDRLMSSVDSDSTMFESLDLIRTEMVKNPAEYFADNYLKDKVLEYIAKCANKWRPDGVGLALFVFDIYKDYISPLASADDIIITYYHDSYTSNLYNACSVAISDIKNNGVDESGIESFKFRYDQYISALRAKLKSAETMAKKDSTLKDTCTKAYTALNGWNYDKYLDYLYNKLVSSGDITIPVNSDSSENIPEAPEEDFIYETLDDGTIKIEKYRGSASYVKIPSKINGKKVTEIGCYRAPYVMWGRDSGSVIGAFEHSDSLISVIIPKSVTKILTYTFRDCKNLKRITIPDSVTSIGYGAFMGCSSLSSITIPNSVTSIGVLAFEYCSSLTSITIPDSITSIGAAEFKDCISLKSITIPNSVTSIEYSAFQNCTSLKSITIPRGVTNIEKSTFEGCSSLTSVTIPDSVISIGEYAFYDCTSLLSVTIPRSVTNLGDNVGSVGYYWKQISSNFRSATKIENFKIYCYAGTAGEEYAKSRGFDYELLDAPHTHSYTSKVTKKATCTAAGVRTYTCSCGDSYTESIAATGHKFGSWTVTKKATCTKTGTKTRKCSVCGKVESQTIKAKGHSYKKVTSKSTYFVKGYTVNKCSVCGATSNKKALPLLVMNAPKAASTTQISIKLSWSKASGASGYCVYQKKSGKWSKIKTTTSTTYTVSNLKAGYAYQFLIKPYKKSGKNTYWGSCSKVLTKSTVPLKSNGYQYRINGNNIEIIKYKGTSTNVTIPSTISGKRVTVLRKSAFSGNSKIKSVNIPGTIVAISEYAFYNCPNLSKVTINNGVKTIGAQAFSVCSKLKSITLPKSITSIGEFGVGFWVNDEFHQMDIYYTLRFRIYCYRNSYAHKYAKKEGIKYTLI